MGYIASESITVFPATRRSATYQKSRMFTEESLSNIVNKLIDMDGFVITKTFYDNLPFEFNIKGYYFKIASGATLTSLFTTATSGDIIYGKIVLDYIGSNYELYGQDTNQQYQGVEFTTDNTAAANTYYLKLLEYDGSSWGIPESSTFKFDKSSLSLIVDGGVI